MEHEPAHRQICKKFGGENLTTYINYSSGGMGGKTWCSNSTSQKSIELHLMNEIVGYHVDALIYAFFSGIVVLVAY